MKKILSLVILAAILLGTLTSCKNIRDFFDKGNITPCEHTRFDIVPAIAPTCLQNGLTEGKKCSDCGEIIGGQYSVPVIDHTYGQWEIIKAATESENGIGIKERSCMCGAKVHKIYYLSDNMHNTYNTTTNTLPDTWNELTYQDSNDTQIIRYINSSFFEYDYKFENDIKYNKDGSINKDGIVDGAYTVNYSAATKLEDVTSTVDAKWGYTEEQKAEGGYAWKITLRDDLKWDDGTPITAADFVYSMQAQLDPDFMNFRANTFYETLRIKNARAYLLQEPIDKYETVASQGYETNEAAIAAGETLYVDIHSLWGAAGYTAADGSVAPQWVTITDETVYASADGTDAISGAALWGGYSSILGPTGSYASYVAIYLENPIREMAWENVGIYAEGNAIVVCLDKAYSLLNADGSLGTGAAYYISSLPLVHKAKYEAAKIAPVEGSTIWTSNYNSSLETTASWGPYMLTEFCPGSHYRLEKNPNWYGWNMEEYKNQYNITTIECDKVSSLETQWEGFLAGNYDDAVIDIHNNEYNNSAYVDYTLGTNTYGIQLYSNLDVLKESDNNNTILAIQQFREAFSLALDRTDMVSKLFSDTTIACLGTINPTYYYDIENNHNLADNGIYRNTIHAKESLLRAYGFTQGADGKWSSNNTRGLTMDEAYYILTGCNPILAKKKLNQAITILTSDPYHYSYDGTQDIILIYGASARNQMEINLVTYLQNVMNELTKDTALDGKIKIILDASWGSSYSDAFKNGKSQMIFDSIFNSKASNPYDGIAALIDPNNPHNFHSYWNTATMNLTITLPAGNYEGAGKTITMSVQNWYFCLNGLATEKDQRAKYNWGEGFAPANARLSILAALEELVIKESRSITLGSNYNGAFLSAKFSHFSENYNAFMGFGGIRYMVVNYTDAEWIEFVGQNNGDLSNIYRES